MNIKVDEIGRRAIIELDPKDYFLVRNKDDADWMGEYALAHRIDMSYKGKDDQEGAPVIYLTTQQAEKLRTIFAEII